jgi:hypothetical protein
LERREIAITTASLKSAIVESDENRLAGQAWNIDSVPGGSAHAKATALAALTRIEQTDLWSFTSADSVEILRKSITPKMVQFDLGPLSGRARSLLAEAVLKTLWERNASRRGRHTFIIIDEAHNLVPTTAVTPEQERTQALINQIAGEGRKYGLYLVVVSQGTQKSCGHRGLHRPMIAIGDPQRSSALGKTAMPSVPL